MSGCHVINYENISEEDYKKLSEQIKELETKLNIEKNKNLSELEQNKLKHQLDPQVWKFVTERLDKLETEINVLRYLRSIEHDPKKPHKCPVCEGSERYKFTPSRGDSEITIECKSCEGKGIVWG